MLFSAFPIVYMIGRIAPAHAREENTHGLALSRVCRHNVNSHFPQRGGARRGAGRKPNGTKPLVSHATRETLAARHPVLVTTKLRPGLPSLRCGAEFGVLTRAFSGCVERAEPHGMRLVHFSVQTNHLHLIVEARDARSLSRGMQGLLVRIARGLNRLWNRSGSVFADRYKARALRSPREMRHALAYVLLNARKHGCFLAQIDPYTSGRTFDGWSASSLAQGVNLQDGRAPPLSRARTWLIAQGWKRHGLIDPDEVPGRAARVRAAGRAGAEVLDLDALHRAARQPHP
jgi:REP element-mobilizing transposase RayT